MKGKGPVGHYVGTALDYYHHTLVVKDKDNTSGATVVDETRGERGVWKDASTPTLDWWDDTWANVGRFLLMDTWAGQAADWTWNNGQDVARIGFGAFDVGLGVSMIWTGAGTLPGIGLIAIGLDQIATGSMNIRYGRVGQGFSVLEFGVYSATGNETAAILTPGVFSLGFGSAGSIGRLGGTAGRALQPGEVVVTGSGGFFSRLRGTAITNEGDVLLYTGAQQALAQRLAQEAARIARVRLGDYVDDVVLISRNISGNRLSPWFNVINGRRTLALTGQTLARPQVGRLIDTLHELNHARQAQRT